MKIEKKTGENKRRNKKLKTDVPLTFQENDAESVTPTSPPLLFKKKKSGFGNNGIKYWTLPVIWHSGSKLSLLNTVEVDFRYADVF